MAPTSRAEQRQLKAEILRHDLKAVILDSEAKGETWTESTAWKNSRRLWNRMPRTGRSSLPLFIVYSGENPRSKPFVTALDQNADSDANSEGG